MLPSYHALKLNCVPFYTRFFCGNCSNCLDTKAGSRKDLSNDKSAKKSPRIKRLPIDSHVTTLLEQIAEGKTVLKFRTGKRIFSQGEKADAIYFIETGKVKLSVISLGGKEAVLSILESPAFVGEGCMVGQTVRLGTATAVVPTTLSASKRPRCSGHSMICLGCPKNSPRLF